MSAKRRIFLDTNILLDVLLEREAFYYDALKIWSACENGLAEGYISAITLNNVYYVVRKLQSEQTAMVCVRLLLRIFNWYKCSCVTCCNHIINNHLLNTITQL